MSFSEEPGLLQKGINRRDLIKKGAVAGAVFWSVPIIESVTSRAAAQSGCVSFNASWIYVVYTVTGQSGYFYTGFSKNDSGTACTAAAYPVGGKDNPNPPVATGQCSGGIYFQLNPTSGTPAAVVYGSTSSPTTPAVYVGTGSCSNYLTQSNGEVTPVKNSGVTIVAAFCFGKSSAVGSCIDSSTNSTCANCDATN